VFLQFNQTEKPVKDAAASGNGKLVFRRDAVRISAIDLYSDFGLI
jgi:hypothetical protein